MMDFSMISALLVMGGLGLVFGAGLAIASKIFYVKRDKRVVLIEEALPGANCGGCGAPGCSGFAEGVVQGNFPVTGCTAGGADVATKIAEIMGTEAGDIIAKIAVVRCRGDHENATERAVYNGIHDCKAATLIDNGAKGCEYGCLGLGTCVEACPFNAMHMGPAGLPVVDEDLCTGCGECVRACPRGIMALQSMDQPIYIACVSRDFGKNVKEVCKAGCIGCSMCANPKFTANEVITMDGKLPVIHFDKLVNPVEELTNAVQKCPANCFMTHRKKESPEAAVVEEMVTV